MLKDAPIGSVGFYLYNVLYLTLFTGIMTFGMLFVYYSTYQEPNPLKDVELMLGDQAPNYKIIQKNMTMAELSAEEKDTLGSYFEAPEIDRFYVTDKTTSAPVMTVYSVSSIGFGGKVKSLIGTDGERVLGVMVLDASGETAGLGQRVKEQSFQRQFLSKTKDQLPNDRTEWDSKGMNMISGATFSSSSLVDNIKKALNLYNAKGAV